jgi:acyl-CoA thioesterase FadM
MAYEYKVVRRVKFSETDMAGIAHYAKFFKYMEAASLVQYPTYTIEQGRKKPKLEKQKAEMKSVLIEVGC